MEFPKKIANISFYGGQEKSELENLFVRFPIIGYYVIL